MAVLTCDICGSNFPTDTPEEGFVICGLCGTRKVLEKEKTEPSAASENELAKVNNIKDELTQHTIQEEPVGNDVKNQEKAQLGREATEFFENYSERVNVHFGHVLIAHRRSSVQENNAMIVNCTEKIRFAGAIGYTMRACAYIGKGDLNSAIADLGAAIQDVPNASVAYELRGAVYGELGKYNQAINDLDTALRIKPESEDAYYYRSLVYLGKGDFHSAFMDCDKALGLKSLRGVNEFNAHLIRGFLYGRNSDFDKAIIDIETAMQTKLDKLGGGRIDVDAELHDHANIYLKYVRQAQYGKLIQETDSASTEEEYLKLAQEFRAIGSYGNATELAKEFDNKYYILKNQREECERSTQYDKLVQVMGMVSTEEEYQELVIKFRAMNAYKDAIKLANECDTQYRTLKGRREESERQEHYERLVYTMSQTSTESGYLKLVQKLRALGNYKDADVLADECEREYRALKECREEQERQEKERKRQEQYDRLLQTKNAASTEDEYRRLVSDFRAMDGYKDTAFLADNCDEQYNRLRAQREEQERKDREAARRARNRKIISAVAVIVLALGGIAVYFFGWMENKNLTINGVKPMTEEKTNQITDSRDGQKYRTVTIGGKRWMAENLNFQIVGSWCYDNDASNCKKYGRLYDWNAAMSVCPSGWHLPLDKEWESLGEAVGGQVVSGPKGRIYLSGAGTKLKAMSGWNKDGNGVDAYGFSSVPGGYRDYQNGDFKNAGYHSYWWTTTETGSNMVYNRDMGYDNDNMGGGQYYKSGGFSVRCVYGSVK